MAGSDTCPYPKPFPPRFSECPAFQPIPFLPIDSLGGGLSTSWTCRHLEVGRRESGRFYPRCRLGAAEGRLAWAERVGHRLAALRRIRQDMVESTGLALAEFLDLHRAQLAEPRERRAMEAAGEALVVQLREWVAAHRGRLEAIDVAPDTAAAILEDMIRYLMSSSVPITTVEAPPHLIARYPDAVELLAPGRAEVD